MENYLLGWPSLFFAILWLVAAFLAAHSGQTYWLGRRATIALALVFAAQWLGMTLLLTPKVLPPDAAHTVFYAFAMPVLFGIPMVLFVTVNILQSRRSAREKLPKARFVHSVHLANRGKTDLALILEPDIGEHKIPAGEAFKIIGRSPVDGTLEIVNYDSYVAVWPWSEAAVEVWHNDVLVGSQGPVLKQVGEGPVPGA